MALVPSKPFDEVESKYIPNAAQSNRLQSTLELFQPKRHPSCYRLNKPDLEEVDMVQHIPLSHLTAVICARLTDGILL